MAKKKRDSVDDKSLMDFEIDSPYVTIAEAAWMTKKTHQTIRNAIKGTIQDKSKHMSSTKGLRNGKNQILVEIIELERCFGKLRYPPSYHKKNKTGNATYEELKDLSDDEIKAGYIYINGENKRLEEEIANLKSKNKELEEKVDDLLEQRDTFKKYHEDAMAVIKNQSTELKLLPDLSKKGEEQAEKQEELLAAIKKLEDNQNRIAEQLKSKPKKKWFNWGSSNDIKEDRLPETNNEKKSVGLSQ
ncbi:MAG: hypothetical protein ACLFRA_07130 [Alphaproteobacteria bacterium]